MRGEKRWGRVGPMLLAFFLAPVPAGAQGFAGEATVQPVQDLRFGVLLPGFDRRVSPDEVGSRGELELGGRGNYQVQLILPAALTSSAGARLPLSFGPLDGVVVMGTAGTARPFDPARGAALGFRGGIRTARLFLGGTARPAPDQPGGTYTATITVLLARN